MRHVSLFTGIGGFELAAQRVWGDEWEPVLFCEMDKYCQKVLKKHWPDVPIVEDVRDVKKTEGAIDLLTGGFPCQPFSAAGKRDGRSDNRHLWPEMLRVIRAFKPAWVVAENVRGILSIEDGMVFEQVCLDLEDTGYEVQPLVIPAVAVDAHHRRDRVWFVAVNTMLNGCGEHTGQEERSSRRGATTALMSTGEDATYSDNQRLQGGKEVGDTEESRQEQDKQLRGCDRRGRCEWLPEPSVGRVANGIPCRVDRLKCLGNAIVPTCAEMIFEAIKTLDK